MSPRQPDLRPTPRLVVGLAIILVGVLFTLDNLDLLEADRFFDYWPLLLIGIGLVQLASPTPGRWWSLLWIVAGGWILLNNFGLVALDFWDLWPLLLVAAGLALVMGAFRRGVRPAPAAGESIVRGFALMGANQLTNASRSFEGGDLAAVMGACSADLRGAFMAPGGEAVIDTFAFWGGVEVTVPQDWQVVGKVVPILGAFEDKSRPPEAASGPRVVVRGFAIMGGVEVNNQPSED